MRTYEITYRLMPAPMMGTQHAHRPDPTVVQAMRMALVGGGDEMQFFAFGVDGPVKEGEFVPTNRTVLTVAADVVESIRDMGDADTGPRDGA